MSNHSEGCRICILQNIIQRRNSCEVLWFSFFFPFCSQGCQGCTSRLTKTRPRKSTAHILLDLVHAQRLCQHQFAHASNLPSCSYRSCCSSTVRFLSICSEQNGVQQLYFFIAQVNWSQGIKTRRIQITCSRMVSTDRSCTITNDW